MRHSLSRLAGLTLLICTAIALSGVGTASAADLCSTNTSPCTGTKYEVGTVIKAQLKTGTTAVLTNSISNISCKKTKTEHTTKSLGPITYTVHTHDSEECATGSGSTCTFTTINIPWNGTITGSKGNGTFTQQTGGGGNPGFTIVCGFLINCTFTSSSWTYSFTGGNPAILKANGTALERSGGFCPSTSTFDAELEVTSPKPLFVV